jgi:hypothetical protein
VVTGRRAEVMNADPGNGFITRSCASGKEPQAGDEAGPMEDHRAE